MKKGLKILIEQQNHLWHEWRAGGIGGSDAAVIYMAEDFPYETTVQSLWAVKTGRIEPKVIDNKFTQRGHELEPIARELFNTKTGLYTEPACYENGDYPFIKASLDGMTLDGNVIVEIKCPTSKHGFHLTIENQELMKALLPVYYIQMQHQFLATGAAIGYFVSFDPSFPEGEQFHCIEIMPDYSVMETLIRKLQNFWRCVETDVMPSDSGSDDYPMTNPAYGKVGIIQLFGYARAGKDTVGLALKELFDAERFAYADPLKDTYCSVVGITREELEATKETHRNGLVGLGKGMRAVSPDVWATGIYHPEKGFRGAARGKGAYITDGRYLNEHVKAKMMASELGVPYRSIWIDSEERGIGAANQEEEEKTSLMKGVADFTFFNDMKIDSLENLLEYVTYSINFIFNSGNRVSSISESLEAIRSKSS